jgi:hypothetical protein
MRNHGCAQSIWLRKKSLRSDVKQAAAMLQEERRLPVLRIDVQKTAHNNSFRMPLLRNIEIAEVRFLLSSSKELSLPDTDQAYNNFFSPPGNHADIRITFKTNSLPEIAGLQPVFNTGESWAMLRHKNIYFMTYHPPDFEQPFWVAEINHEFTDISVFCSEQAFQPHDKHILAFNPFGYPLDQIVMMYYLAKRQGVIVHAAGIEMNGKGYIFPGRSGAGKTTISRQFVATGSCSMLSDDRVIVKKLENTFMAFGTPWPGEGGIAVNRGIPLAGIFFITHSETNRIEKITPSTTIEKLMPVTSIPWYDPEPMENILGFCNNLITHIPSYILHFRPDTEVVDVLEKFISQNET